MKRKRLMAAVITGIMAMGLFAGCGGSDSGEAGDKKELVVWSHLTKPEVEEFQKVADAWGEENNVTVKVVEDKGDFQALQQAVNSPKGPDVLLGYPHDNLGTFQKAGMLEEVPSDKIKPDAYASKNIMDAVTIDGKVYAYPLAQETTALFYNKDLVKEAPKTMEDVVKIGKEEGFKYDINNFYLTYSFIAANGGYVYKNEDGKTDPSDIGMGNEGAIKGYDFIQSLVVDNKLMGADINGDLAKGDFMSGKSAFYISGPWDIAPAKDAKLNFGIVPLPTLNGKETPSFMGVQSGFVSSKSDDKDLAFDLLEDLSTEHGDIVYTKGNRIPVTKVALEKDEVKNNVEIQGFIKQAEKAHPMPNIPEVQAMWTPAADNLKLLTAGRITPEECGKQIVDQIKEGISQQK